MQQEKTYSGSQSAAAANRRVRPSPSRANIASTTGRQQQQPALSQEDEASAEPVIYGSVAGTPGVDFPGFTKLPTTSFTCSGVPYEPGMYADEETGCQAYHVCFQGRKESFLCGVGTVFNQAILACDYWHSVECSRSKEFYSVNEELGLDFFLSFC